MQNIKLHKIYELLEELKFIDYEEPIDAIESLDLFMQNVFHMQLQYPQEHIYYKVLEQLHDIATEKSKQYVENLDLPTIE